MVLFAADSQSGYFQHHDTFSLFNQPAWTDTTTMGGRVALLVGRYVGFWDRLCCRPQLDGADGTGVTPIVPLALLALSAAGMALALWRRSGLWAVLGALLIVVLPLGAVITVEGLARRTFAMAPFLAAFAGYAVVALWRMAAQRGPALRAVTATALACVTGARRLPESR